MRLHLHKWGTFDIGDYQRITEILQECAKCHKIRKLYERTPEELRS